jgi:peptidoglycan hydrolase CwlO-like protein
MNLEWILSPLAIYAAVALTLVISAGLWVGAKVETARLKRTLQDTRKELAASDEARKTLAAKVNDLEGAINRLADQSDEARAGIANAPSRRVGGKHHGGSVRAAQ